MEQHAGLVRFIGVLKLLKGLVLGAVAIGLFENQKLQSLFWRAIGYFSERAVTAAGIVTGVYAVVFLVEGAGLLAARRWAEWLTVIITASFVPLEILKLVKHTTAPGIVTLVANLAIVVYLAARLWLHRGEAHAHGGAPAAA